MEEIIDAPDTTNEPHWFDPWMLLPSACIVMMWEGGWWWLIDLGFRRIQYDRYLPIYSMNGGIYVALFIAAAIVMLLRKTDLVQKRIIAHLSLTLIIVAVPLLVPKVVFCGALGIHLMTVVMLVTKIKFHHS